MSYLRIYIWRTPTISPAQASPLLIRLRTLSNCSSIVFKHCKQMQEVSFGSQSPGLNFRSRVRNFFACVVILSQSEWKNTSSSKSLISIFAHMQHSESWCNLKIRRLLYLAYIVSRRDCKKCVKQSLILFLVLKSICSFKNIDRSDSKIICNITAEYLLQAKMGPNWKFWEKNRLLPFFFLSLKNFALKNQKIVRLIQPTQVKVSNFAEGSLYSRFMSNLRFIKFWPF